jgi:ATP-dependent DNA helicase RecG
MDLSTLVKNLPKTSPRTISRLESIGIKTYFNLLNYYPFRYEDYSKKRSIGELIFNEVCTIKGRVTSIKTGYTKKGMQTQTLKVADKTGTIDILFFNQKFLSSIISVDATVAISGSLARFGRTLTFMPLDYEVMSSVDSKTVHTGRIIPVYSQIYGLSAKTIREKMSYLLSLFSNIKPIDVEILPDNFLSQFKLLGKKAAIEKIHYPDSILEADKAKERLAFDELFLRILSSYIVKKNWQNEITTKPLALNHESEKRLHQLISNLPFNLTSAQKRTLDEILQDMTKITPMNRFVQGDVGSGKTVIAGLASYVAYLNSAQTLIMAPTTILAEQHYTTLTKLLSPLGLKIGIQTGSKKLIKKNQKESVFDIIVGTHALITESLNFSNVGLVVIDEQHRFGVKQRATLKQKGINPHLLTMTATPIPRTVSLTLYSELDLSVIDEMPMGRKPIKTHVVSKEKRAKGYEWIKEQIRVNSAQVYIICPLVEESDNESMTSVKAVTKEFELLKKSVFKENNVALLHGKMKGKEKTQIMDDFKAKKYDILVSTSVVEVGVDVPDATIMIIEGAERFGLAQLHQLRGRVGRSDKQSYCFLFPSNKQAEFSKRLKFFESTNSGMKLAEYDLRERGPGDLYGTKQSGYSDLVLADISDISMVHRAKQAVEEFTKNFTIKNFPVLKKAVEELQVEQISKD